MSEPKKHKKYQKKTQPEWISHYLRVVGPKGFVKMVPVARPFAYRPYKKGINL